MNLILPCAPGCCNSTGCVIAEDDFNRSDNTDINAGAPFEWEGDTSDMVIATNWLRLPNNTPFSIKCPIARSSSEESCFAKIECTTMPGSVGAYMEVWIGEDLDNRVLVRISRDTVLNTAIFFQIILVVGGVEEVLNESLTVDAPAILGGRFLTLYYDHTEGVVHAIYPDEQDPNPQNERKLCADLDDLPGLYAGVKGFTGNSSLNRFDLRWFSYEKIRVVGDTYRNFCEARVCPDPPEECDSVTLDCCDDWPRLFGQELKDWVAAHPMEILIPSGTFAAKNCSLASCQTLENVPLIMEGRVLSSGRGTGYEYQWPSFSGSWFYLPIGTCGGYFALRVSVLIECTYATLNGNAIDEDGNNIWSCRKVLIIYVNNVYNKAAAEVIGDLGDCFLTPTYFEISEPTSSLEYGACELAMGKVITFRPSL